jgi:hypothetical protein
VGLAVFGALVGFENVGVRVVGAGVGRVEGVTVGVNVGHLSGSPRAPDIKEITNKIENKNFTKNMCVISIKTNFDFFFHRSKFGYLNRNNNNTQNSIKNGESMCVCCLFLSRKIKTTSQQKLQLYPGGSMKRLHLVCTLHTTRFCMQMVKL